MTRCDSEDVTRCLVAVTGTKLPGLSIDGDDGDETAAGSETGLANYLEVMSRRLAWKEAGSLLLHASPVLLDGQVILTTGMDPESIFHLAIELINLAQQAIH